MSHPLIPFTSLPFAMPTAMLGLLTATLAGGTTVTPSQIDLVLNPGDMTSVDVEVCIPGESGFAKADVYILADTTGSMGSIINQLKVDAAAIVTDLLGQPSIDLQIGIGNYKDFPSDIFAFQNQEPITDDSAALQAAINNWFASGGNDGSEGQLFALNQIAVDPAIGWRPDSKRIVVWFGDAPGHDPICAAISGEAADITEASVTADLVGAGPGGTVTIAISTITGFALGLNDDPTFSAGDYAPFCSIGGASGQADRIAAATDGISLSGVSSMEITDTILDAVEVVLSEVDVSLLAKGDTADFITSIEPAVVSVEIPSDPTQEVCATFTVNFAGQNCVENVSTFLGQLNVLFDGAPAGVSIPVTIDQPECDTACLMFLGFQPANHAIGHPFAGPEDRMFVGQLYMNQPVTMEVIPAIAIPDNPAVIGLHAYTQVGMLNAFDFPGDPIQMSNGLDFTIGGSCTSFGTGSGITQWCDTPTAPGGVVQIGFSIDAFGE